MKKIIIIFLIVFFMFPKLAMADDMNEELENEIIETSNINNMQEVNVSSKNAIILERKTHTVLYEKNAYVEVAMASTTKIMTCIIALENCDLAESVEVSSKSANVRGSCLGLKKGDKISVNDLLYGLMLRSRK